MKRVIIIADDRMGQGPPELTERLIVAFLAKLCQAEKKPEHIVLYGNGVKLAAEGSPVLHSLHVLSQEGVDIVACGTCVGYFEISERMSAGAVGDMRQIVALLLDADSVIAI